MSQGRLSAGWCFLSDCANPSVFAVFDRAALDCDFPKDGFEKGGLASTVTPDQADPAALGQLYRSVFN